VDSPVKILVDDLEGDHAVGLEGGHEEVGYSAFDPDLDDIVEAAYLGHKHLSEVPSSLAEHSLSGVRGRALVEVWQEQKVVWGRTSSKHHADILVLEGQGVVLEA
jgi:hypothetical protein